MWQKTQQHIIGATSEGKPIHFHFDQSMVKDHSPHSLMEASQHHDRLRGIAATYADKYAKMKVPGLENGFRKLAQHHAQTSKKFSKAAGL